ncbi:MAG: hypothetical protein L3J22_05600 [Xanthomonadales bacterium]|nr:hypothetical protein [Xanthomonadales bacterium]
MTGLAKLISGASAKGGSEALAAYIENGGDLSEIDMRGREVLSHLLLGKSVRKRGRPKKNEKRNRDIRREVAYLKGNGLPAHTNDASQRWRSVPAVQEHSTTAAKVISEVYGLTEKTIIKIWDKRDKDDPEWAQWEASGAKIKEGLPW